MRNLEILEVTRYQRSGIPDQKLDVSEGHVGWAKNWPSNLDDKDPDGWTE